MKPYILAIDQSTQGTKGVVFDGEGTLLARADRPHAQKIDANGWVEHDPREILQNTLAVAPRRPGKSRGGPGGPGGGGHLQPAGNGAGLG